MLQQLSNVLHELNGMRVTVSVTLNDNDSIVKALSELNDKLDEKIDLYKDNILVQKVGHELKSAIIQEFLAKNSLAIMPEE